MMLASHLVTFERGQCVRHAPSAVEGSQGVGGARLQHGRMDTFPHALRPFADRVQAGRALAARLLEMDIAAPVTVLALPRGGVPVAAEVARALRAPLDLVLVRKISLPGQPELAVAALVDGNPPALVVADHFTPNTTLRDEIEMQTQQALHEIARRREVYLHGREPLPLEGRTAVLVDDGIATGTTMRAALKAVRARHPARLVLAVPVAPADTLAALRHEADAVVCLMQPPRFRAVGEHYVDFTQVDDEGVLAALAAAVPSTP
jgi:putative phosphoribosyl transferase